MNQALSRIGLWLWYLVPANPILVRVVYGMSRRTRHLWLRFGYLAILLAVVTVTLLTVGTSRGASLGDLAKGASQTFMYASITQLLLMCFLAPVFTAGAITQERDAQTYNILISTPLSNAQIVIGSLLSRLYFVVVLLIAGLPIFVTTMVYGGVTQGQIIRSFAIAGATAAITGSLAITISMVRVGTRRTIFSFFLGIGIYLCAVYFLGTRDFTHLSEAPVMPVSGRQMSWLAAFHPFLALDVALNRIEAPDLAAVSHYGTFVKYFLAYPPQMYVVSTLFISCVLIVLSMFYVRRGTREGEGSLFSGLWERIRPNRASTTTRKPHAVWSNPVAWREAVTRASATTRSLGRYLVIGCGLLGACVLLYFYMSGLRGFTPTVTRSWLAGIVAIEFGIVLIIATNTAASSLTKDKESNSLDIMLTTPLTSEYIIWGKLRGLVSFVLPLILVPAVSLLIFAVYDLLKRPPERVAYLETAVEVGLLLVVFAAYACMLGLHFSLKQKKTIRAVILAVGVLIVANLVAYFFWQAIIEAADILGTSLAPATPFTAIGTLIDPSMLFASTQEYLSKVPAIRISALVGCAIFVCLHAAIVFSWYKSMVKGFDMIIRKQSGTR
ncbi:MAG TPA: ABC transporter permease subunit [Phycisphaerae bacterium]|nr:ABC transporter permease subunit [Phycisphaerales bacterium]HRX84907.1 ABC transporter permease subunit [Phycisphaerae bacterium]